LGTRFDPDQQCQVPDIYLVSALKQAVKPMENNHEENNIVRQCRDNWCELSRRTYDLLVMRDGQEPKKTSWTGMIFLMTSRTQTAEALKLG
jgi:hypothetical protein